MKKFLVLGIATLFEIAVGAVLMMSQTSDDYDYELPETKVGVILNGYIDNHALAQATYEGLEAVKDELNLNITYMEDIYAGEEVRSSIETLIENGCTIIISTSHDYIEDTEFEAQQHADIYFLQLFGEKYYSNYTSYRARIYQISYLAGLVAGNETSTDKIGYLAAIPGYETLKNINAFTKGVRDINPYASVIVSYSGSWTDEDINTYATKELLDNNSDIDILAYYTDSLAPIEYADSVGIKTIGNIMDLSELYPDTILTSCIYNFEEFYRTELTLCIQQKLNGSYTWDGIDTEVVSLAPISDNNRNKISSQMLTAEKQGLMASGKWDVYKDKIRDNHQIIRLYDGEWMSDYSILNEMDWYIDGVELYEVK